jgi:HSP20 family protein
MTQLSKWFPFRFKRKQNESTVKEGESPSPSPALPPQSGLAAWSPMAAMLDRMFSEDLWRMPMSGSRDFDRFFGDFTPGRFHPSIDVLDEGKSVRVSVELPGMDKNDIKLEVHDGVLTLRGHKQQEHESEESGCYRTERFYGSFLRHVPLPEDLQFERAEAQFDKGVLTVRFPKQKPAQPAKVIEIR